MERGVGTNSGRSANAADHKPHKVLRGFNTALQVTLTAIKMGTSPQPASTSPQTINQPAPQPTKQLTNRPINQSTE